MYAELAWAYDPVSLAVSRGRWPAWRRAALPYIVGPRVVDLGCGTGQFLGDLSDRSYSATGVDRSSTMLRQARRAMGSRRGGIDLVQADLRLLPFAAGTFDTATLTFPTPVIRDQILWRELARVLRPDGRVVAVLGARSLRARIDVRAILDYVPVADFGSEAFDVEVEGSLVSLVVATARRERMTQPNSELTDSSR